MACVVSMDAKRKFLALLQQANRARMAERQLEWLDASGSVVTKFEAVYLK